MTITVNHSTELTVRETLATGVPAVTSRATIVHDGFNDAAALGATTTPPATTFAAFIKTLAAGVGTIDLTSLPGTNGATVTGSGLKVQAVKFRNPSTNTGSITLTFGASNGYLMLGSAWKLALNPGECFEWVGNDKAAVPDIDGTHKNIDLAGTTTEVLDCVIVMG